MGKRSKSKRSKVKKVEWHHVFASFGKLIENDVINVNFVDPTVFLSMAAYKVFCCDESGIMPDDKKMTVFFHNLRMYINFKRAHMSGLRRGLIEEAMEDVRGAIDEGEPRAKLSGTVDDDADEMDKWAYPPLDDKDWIKIYVAGSDNKSCIIYGKENGEGLELKPYVATEETEATEDTEENEDTE